MITDMKWLCCDPLRGQEFLPNAAKLEIAINRQASINMRSRFLLSSGTTPARTFSAGPRYATEAIVAQESWVPLPSRGIWSPTPKGPLARCILLVKPSSSEIGRLRSLTAAALSDPSVKGQAANQSISIIDKILRTESLCPYDIIFETFQVHDFPARHTSVHPRTGELVGLHLDSWSRLPDSQRGEGSLRACVNLGRVPRCLDVIPITSEDGLSWLVASGKAEGSWSAGPLAQRLLAQRPDLKVLRLTQYPGELYVAPTENLIHDGVRVVTDEPDLTLAVRVRLAVISATA